MAMLTTCRRMMPWTNMKRKLPTVFLAMCFCLVLLFVVNHFYDATGSRTHMDIAGFKELQTLGGIVNVKKKVRRRPLYDDDDMQVCRMPKLSLETDANKDAFHAMDPLHCQDQNLFYLKHGQVFLNRTTLGNSKIGKCEYTPIRWLSDEMYSLGEPLAVTTDPFVMDIKWDFVKVECFLERNKEKVAAAGKFSGEQKQSEEGEGRSDADRNDTGAGSEMYRRMSDDYYEYHGGFNAFHGDFQQFFARIQPKQDVIKRISRSNPSKDSLQMNVLMFAMDSMSHLSYQRKLPKTYNYLKNHLKAVILNGYNIVGDATTAAILPILTGKAEVELPEVRRGHPGATFVDRFPFVWNKYEQNGYVTLFAEDQPSLGTFQLRFHGFEQEPVDHYIRSFWQAAHDSQLYADSTRYCLGHQPLHQYTLDYLQDFFDKYSKLPKFAFGFLGELSHHDNNPAEYIDKDLQRFLATLESEGHLNNTLLIVMGDHGARYSAVRKSLQGKLEERLPLMSLTYPKWFQEAYPQLMQHLKDNANRLTTAFDLHETLKDVLDIKRSKQPVDFSARGISLLQDIPSNRTCRSAGIDMHWCTCMMYEEVDLNHQLIKQGAKVIIDEINRLTKPHRDQCLEFTIKTIQDAKMIIPNEKLIRYLKSIDKDQRIANYSTKLHLDLVHYQIIISTAPNEAMFEGTVMYDIKNNDWHLTTELSRINQYGSQPHCIMKTFPEIRKYCQCKVLPPKPSKTKRNQGDTGVKRAR